MNIEYCERGLSLLQRLSDALSTVLQVCQLPPPSKRPFSRGYLKKLFILIKNIGNHVLVSGLVSRKEQHRGRDVGSI